MLGILSHRIHDVLDLSTLVDVVLDLGRPVVARMRTLDGSIKDQVLSGPKISSSELDAICISTVLSWTSDDRDGIDDTMHRISRIRDPIYDKVANLTKVRSLTVRVGRSVLGTVETIADII